MDFFPIFLNLKNRSCLVVGGGSIAKRKIELLLRSHANVTVIAPKIQDEIKALIPAPICIYREFSSTDLDNIVLVIAATSDTEVNAQVSNLATAENIPVNVVDNPDLCTFIMPSVVDRNPIIVAVSSSGRAPLLARRIKTKLETVLPASLGRLGNLVGKYRQAVKESFNSVKLRRNFWEQVLEGEVAEKVYSGRDSEAEEQLREMLQNSKGNGKLTSSKKNTGDVALIGGGPGDPDLLTFKAVRLLQRADVVVYDRLISEEIVNLARKDATRIYAGKEKSKHSIPQPEINKLLVDLARQGKRVVRLKGGDPFLFGRGGEEIGELNKYGIPFQVVPGISSASGCSSYCGIPLTHRDYAQSVVFVTGHLKNNTVNLDWEMLAHENQTSVIFMGLGGINHIVEKIIEHGLSKNTPVAVIHKGTTPEQKLVIGDLSSIADKVRREALSSPSLIIIGEVVRLHDQLKWYEETA